MPSLPPIGDPGAFRSLGVGDIEAYFGVWAVREEPFLAAVNAIDFASLPMHVASQASAGQSGLPRRLQYSITEEGTALIPLQGVMMKRVSSLSDNASTIAVRQQIRHAVRNDDVSGILLVVDSPGGTVAGTAELANEVAKAAKQIPLDAFIEDVGASAAYWVASQARRVYANPTALVGSIGTFAVLQDASGMAAQLGVKVHVIRAGKFKGAGQPGTEVTAEQITETQRIVDELNSHFLQGVARGRSMLMDRVSELADGRVHLGEAAVALGLIDGVRSFDATLAGFARAQQGGRNMAKTEDSGAVEATFTELVTSPLSQAATYAEVVSECVGADASFVCEQLKVNATIQQARQAWMVEQQKRLVAAENKVIKPAGVKPITAESAAAAEDPIDAVAEWNAEIEKLMASGRTHRKAASILNRRNPELREAMVRQFNEQRQSSR